MREGNLMDIKCEQCYARDATRFCPEFNASFCDDCCGAAMLNKDKLGICNRSCDKEPNGVIVPMKKFSITVGRTATYMVELEIEAASEEEAKKLVGDEMEEVFSGRSAWGDPDDVDDDIISVKRIDVPESKKLRA
jgi:hypothetical protein